MHSPSRILVVGGGGREHALAWRLANEPGIDRVLVAPGNPGMEEVAEVVGDVRADDSAAIAELCREREIELVVVGPEGPLVNGLADALRARDIAVFGPGAAAARIEGSKAFCREVATAAGVPMAEGEAFSDAAAAVAYAARLAPPVVVKADGLAAGKGVTVCSTTDEAEAAIRDALSLGIFGRAGERIVVERALEGSEASVIAICDESTALALPAARDHKRLRDGDRGPNTGGMGAYSPVPELSDEDVAEIVKRFHRPVLAELARRGAAFRGALYAGLMLTADGPRLLEFNARFGDPEAQAILPRVDVPLAPLLLAAGQGRLAEGGAALGVFGRLVPAAPHATVAIVLAAAGYPGRVEQGDVIEEDDRALGGDSLVFYAGVASRAGRRVTAGGRVLTVVGSGRSVDEAAEAAYEGAGRVWFRGCRVRRDIGRGVAAPRVAVPA